MKNIHLSNGAQWLQVKGKIISTSFLGAISSCILICLATNQ